MIKSFIVEVYDNGVVIKGAGVGNGFNKVFENSNIETALTEVYRLMDDNWRVGSRVHIVEEDAKVNPLVDKKDTYSMRIEG